VSRISERFAELKKQKRAGLIPFIMGGDPTLSATAALLKSLPEAGADLIEIGIPFSDPMADGPVIQAAGLRALKAGTSVHDILKLVHDFRKHDNETPIILMGYYNPVYRYGIEDFCADAAKAGVDGLIIVDLPPEEERELKPHLEASNLVTIRLMAPTSSDKRLMQLARTAQGFVYYIAMTGVTGGQSASISELKEQVIHVRRFTKLPVAVGFGIRTPEQAKKIGRFASAVVVGSALVDVMAKKKTQKSALAAGLTFVRSLAKALR
jgi:tryptophan synthase alpha chain